MVDASQAAVFKNINVTNAHSFEGDFPSPAQTPDNLALYLLFAFVGGLILNIMPCVFPVLAIKVTSVVHQAHDDKGKVLIHGIIYTLGVLASLWTLAIIQLALKAAGHNVAWGDQFHAPWFVFGVILVMLIFGLNMAGLLKWAVR